MIHRSASIPRMNEAQSADDYQEESRPGSITVQVLREVEGHAGDKVAKWVHDGQAVMANFPGYLGSGFLRNSPGSELWRMIYRFDNSQDLQRWEQSPERARWAEEFSDFVKKEDFHHLTGVEGWFDTEAFEQPSADSTAPPRWKQMVVIFLGFYPMTMAANLLLNHYLPTGTPLPLKVTLAVFMVMPLMVYIVLPFMTKLFQPWLEKPRH